MMRIFLSNAWRASWGNARETLRDRIWPIHQASRIAETKGLILCDTKFEFGVLNGQVHLDR